MTGNSPNLDLLRSIAVGLVVFSHLGVNLGWSGPNYDIERVGRVGVAIFFVHTSLVLMMSLQRNGGAARVFFVRRLFRIYPLSVAIVSLLALAGWLAGANVDGRAVLSNLLLVQNITGHASRPPPLWSLPYEVQMYMLLPALYAVTRAHSGALRVVMLLAGSIAFLTLLRAAGWPFALLQYLPCFLPGVLAFVLGRRVKARRSPAALFAVVAVGAAAVPALITAGAPETPLLWGLCLALGLTIPACRQITIKPLARAAHIIAEHSYSIYLTHLLAIAIGLGLFPALPLVAKLALFLAALAACARVCYRWIERPGMALGVRIASRLNAARGAAQA